ncbi:hypothetical protein AB0K57_32780 [Streptomyces halstedii]|uniref:hypothetical protein n=1 Tax=Streptomyces halstedii TaxID=1944 RepID=UPI00346112F3
MLAEGLTALAAAGGAAVVQAASTDLWTEFRHRVAQALGRGDARRERVELERLDRTQATLARLDATSEADAERVREQQTAWQTRIADRLEELDEAGQQQVAIQLRALLAEYPPPHGSVQTGTHAGRDVNVRADDGIAAGTINGGVHLGNPPPPGPDQG